MLKEGLFLLVTSKKEGGDIFSHIYIQSRHHGVTSHICLVERKILFAYNITSYLICTMNIVFKFDIVNVK
jgi:hypothetical protein